MARPRKNGTAAPKAAEQESVEQVQTVTQIDEAISGVTVSDEEKTPRKVRVCAMLRGTYGNYNPGDVAEFDKPIADAFVAAGICKEME